MKEELPNIPKWLHIRPLYIIAGIIILLVVYAGYIEMKTTSHVELVSIHGDTLEVKAVEPLFSLGKGAQFELIAEDTCISIRSIQSVKDSNRYQLVLCDRNINVSGKDLQLSSYRKVYQDYIK